MFLKKFKFIHFDKLVILLVSYHLKIELKKRPRLTVWYLLYSLKKYDDDDIRQLIK